MYVSAANGYRCDVKRRAKVRRYDRSEKGQRTLAARLARRIYAGSRYAGYAKTPEVAAAWREHFLRRLYDHQQQQAAARRQRDAEDEALLRTLMQMPEAEREAALAALIQDFGRLVASAGQPIAGSVEIRDVSAARAAIIYSTGGVRR